MTLALSQLYLGPLDFLTPPRVEATPGADTLPAHRLLDPARLEALFTRFGAQYGHGDRRAVASLWSKWHFAGLAAHGLAANLLLERDLPLGIDTLHVIQTDEGQTAGFSLRHAGRPLGDLDGLSRFATLVDDHLAPLIEALASISGASPKVFWSNAGNYIEHFTNALADHPMASAGTVDPARALITSRHLPDGRRNPLYQPVRYVEPATPEAPSRVRRQCCIRYLIDELGYCANCPLECRRQGKASKAEKAATLERAAS
ncbi:transporter [Halomonas halophila]|uniref:Transporter n=1 Tax=Halomonas halophila TaxID=29573 RepID=A0ABQ0U5L8_9GAMM|nr:MULTISPECIES: siderophore-iron reductase FhuF [Halomonas]MDR5890304.1 siderophore-iron reductase FhuF [Halomonas salina]GEK73752.1 transporter [Halomonas halophila]